MIAYNIWYTQKTPWYLRINIADRIKIVDIMC